MNIYNKVYGSLNWKKSDEYCSKKLGISLDKYKTLKQNAIAAKRLEKYGKNQQVVEVREDLEKGTAEIKGISLLEPKTPEEIIKLLKIDTKKWRLSNYWNKQQGDKWVVSALVTQIKPTPDNLLAKVLENFNPSPFKVPTKPILNANFAGNNIAILSIQDLHFGKEGNDSITKDFEKAVTNLIMRAYHSHNLDKIIYVFGGDLLNMDTFHGTTTNGTPVHNDMKAYKAYEQAFNAIHWSIAYLSTFTNNLHVVFLPGNHDRLSSYHLAHALSKCFNDPRITFDASYSERKVVTYGNNFFAFEHGDVTKKNTPLVYATEYPKEWGSTVYRTCYTGHFHSKKTTEYITENEQNGFAIKHLPSLCGTDYWHYHNKFVGSKQQAILEIHDFEKGKCSEFTYSV